ncbi:hypothetical protein [Xenorhabdus eapokensis]|uniref:Uncharacterized protein n=1 Tax=Xenorhabdus eapokensis TaxID=1873482 RepID=A0A1Q5TD55_9GAMM|nr:hypothetical protein [Xenorhabdus eapokensis]OKO98151.1 hypothetical protein Xedl_03860 [Xenorhabdus eapokensis]
MSGTGIMVSKEDFAKLSERTREELLELVTNSINGHIVSENITNNEEEPWEPTDLSSIQAAKFVKGLGEKSRRVLKTILEVGKGEKGEFWCKDVAKKLDIKSESLTGVWSGLTRRIRSVTEDEDACLFDWQPDDNRCDYQGTFHEVTYKNLKKVLNI